jgi:hypothetical protein
MSLRKYHVAKGHTLVIAKGDRRSEFQTVALDPADPATAQLIAAGSIKPGPGRDETEADQAELALAGDESIAEALPAPDGAPKSAKPTGKARDEKLVIEGVELTLGDVLARAFADFGGTVAAWNKLGDEDRTARLEAAAETLAGVTADEEPADADADEDPADADADEDPADDDADQDPADDDADQDPADADADQDPAGDRGVVPDDNVIDESESSAGQLV